MHLTLRRIIFYSLVAVFIVGGAYAVLTAFGLSIGEGGALLRTGSLFAAAAPRDAELLVDGTRAEERPKFLSGGTLVKNLTPRVYEVRFERADRTPWHAALPVRSGLVTRATGVFLWPRAATSTILASRATTFALSAGVPVIATEGGALSRESTRVPGTAIAYASNDRAALITRTDGTVYLAARGRGEAAVNLTALFYSLKERELGLPGAVPLISVRPHPFSAGKILITTETSLYILDTRRVSLERIATIPKIAAVAWSDSEVFLFDTEGNLTAADLVFKTVATAPFASGTVARLEATSDGAALVALGEEGTLSVFRRETSLWRRVAAGVSDFAIAPDGSRLAYARGNGVSVYFINRYEGDVSVPPETDLAAWEGNAAPRALAWNPALPRYLHFLSEDKLIAAEIGLHGERNHATLAENVRVFAFAGFTAYALKDDDTLVALSLE